MNLDQYLQERGLTRELLDEAGVDYDDDKVTFHSYNEYGAYIGNVERRLSSSPRFVNNLNMSDMMYPIHLSLSSIFERQFAIIVEGQPDALAIYGSGVKNVLAFGGASNFGKRKFRILRRYCNGVWMIFDRDDAGLQFYRHMKKKGIVFPVEVSFTPEGYKDPAEFISKGGRISDIERWPLSESGSV